MHEKKYPMGGGGISMTARKRARIDPLFSTSRDSPFQGLTLDSDPRPAKRCHGGETEGIVHGCRS